MSDPKDQKHLWTYDDTTGFFNAFDGVEQYPSDYWPWGQPKDLPRSRYDKLDCIHDAVEYVGFSESYMYCSKCNAKL